jgi:eukaryotic-like serine/threonine-protein kinase
MNFNLMSLFRKSRSRTAPMAAHMTFAQTSAGHTLMRSGQVLRQNIWIWPILGAVLLFTLGYSVSSMIRRTMKASFQSELQTLLHVETRMLKTWLKVQAAGAEAQANNRGVREVVERLIGVEETAPQEKAQPEKSKSELIAQLTKDLSPGMVSHDFVGYFVVNRNQKILASSNVERIGLTIPDYEPFLTRTMDGNTTISTPFPSVVMMKDESGKLRTGTPTMYVCSPVRDNGFQVVGALAFQIRPEREFTKILQLGRIGESGETYAFDKNGLMVSNSRFDDQLILLGLLPDNDSAKSILNLQVRNPGGDMTRGFRPKVRRAELPLTKMAQEAISGKAGVDVEGYPDYRGVPVVGAWDWLPEYEMGVVTEVDYAEAFRPLNIVQWMFTGIYVLLGISSVAIFIFTLIVAKMRREAQKAAIESKQLGQYVLNKKLGSGAMGVVYKGHHAMLRRPTAIKMLNIDVVNDASIARFEREVQITSQLNHPNTIAIYDYGRTPEGVFYYAMEYLDGIDLQQMVDRYGPQPEGRVIKILTQICGSLYEAHAQGLVHRDIKPANIMLNRRGGEPDLVKVLDFGLVKAIDDDKKQKASTTGLTGTPLYMSPEAIQFPLSVDARSDIYAVGAVGYFLLTGKAVFDAKSIVELCQFHISKVPTPPSEVLGKPVSQALEDAIMACLEKSSAKRPQTARDLALMLTKSSTAHAWAIDTADGWWGRHERGQDTNAVGSTSESEIEATIIGQKPGSENGGSGTSKPSDIPLSQFDETVDR